jgi:hypothetical protein
VLRFRHGPAMLGGRLVLAPFGPGQDEVSAPIACRPCLGMSVLLSSRRLNLTCVLLPDSVRPPRCIDNILSIPRRKRLEY